jgi:hypothetical protein
LFVYGRSAQQRLAEARVLVIAGDGATIALAAEVTKNLALAGVGQLFIASSLDELQCGLDITLPSLLGTGDNAQALSAYARELNPGITVTDVDLSVQGWCVPSAEATDHHTSSPGRASGSSTSSSGPSMTTKEEKEESSPYDVVVNCAGGLSSHIAVNTRCRTNRSRFVGCSVAGIFGLVFDDFLDRFESSTSFSSSFSYTI